MPPDDSRDEIEDDREFTPWERRRLRKLVRDDDRADALKKWAKATIIMLGAIAAAVTAVKVLLADFVVRLVK